MLGIDLATFRFAEPLYLWLLPAPAALLAHYRDGGKLIDVNGLQPVEKVTEALLRAVHGTENGPK